MKIRAIEVEGAFTHGSTRVELPERGIVTVSGKNGSGKSALLVEVPAGAVYGKTLRGTSPWPTEAKASLGVELDSALGPMRVLRAKTAKGAPKLHVTPIGWEWPEHLRKSDGTAQLAVLFGSMLLWQRTHVFSASDAATFMLTTDGECKRFLEGMLGLDVFDPALKACRRDLAKATGAVREAEHKGSIIAERVAAQERAIAEAKRAVAEHAVPESPSDELLEKWRAAAKKEDELKAAAAQRERAAYAQRLASANVLQQLKMRAAQAEEERARLDRGECSTCGQAIPDKLRMAARGKAKSAAKRLEEQRAELAEELDRLDATIDGSRAEASQHERRAAEYRQRVLNADGQREAAAGAGEQHARLEGRLKEARKKLAWLEEQQDEAGVAVATLAARRGVLAAAERVLGLRGPRVQVLANALGGLEEAANAWLDRLFLGCALRLETTEDAIVRHVDGLAHDLGYKACSSGQRRRVDIAVLLALAEVAAGSAGAQAGPQGDGTLVFDEALDALDDEGGLDAAIEVVEGLAEDRCVVVISHRADLLARLGAVRRLRVEGGKVA